MRICFIGDIVAAPGRRVIRNVLPDFLRNNEIDFCIVNAENSVHGLGVSSNVIDELFSLGVDVITLGNHTFAYRDFIPQANNYQNVVVPANVSSKWPGSNYAIVKKNGMSLGVINLLGQVSMDICCDSPFDCSDILVELLSKNSVNAVVVDFHAEATSEKKALGYYLDGRASLVLGTHTHVQTADNVILKEGTGYITDVGMTGCLDSVIGMDISTSLTRFVDKMPARYKPAEGEASMCGIIADVDYNGKCTNISRFCEYE